MRQILRDPLWQNAVAGVCIGFSAGIFVSLNLLGAGGGRPDSAQVVQITNAVLLVFATDEPLFRARLTRIIRSSVWFFSGCFGRAFLNSLGPGPTLSAGELSYSA